MNPDLRFYVVGDVSRVFPEDAGRSNVTMHPFVYCDELRRLYRSAKVYCQLSIHEGLPNALCEAMLCGCVPVGTSANGIPRAIGDTGFIVPRDPAQIGDAIRQALLHDENGIRARSWISEMFPLSRRRRELGSVLERLAAEG